MSKIRVAVFGASGYAGEELLRLLLRHGSPFYRIAVELHCSG